MEIDDDAPDGDGDANSDVESVIEVKRSMESLEDTIEKLLSSGGNDDTPKTKSSTDNIIDAVFTNSGAQLSQDDTPKTKSSTDEVLDAVFPNSGQLSQDEIVALADDGLITPHAAHAAAFALLSDAPRQKTPKAKDQAKTQGKVAELSEKLACTTPAKKLAAAKAKGKKKAKVAELSEKNQIKKRRVESSSCREDPYWALPVMPAPAGFVDPNGEPVQEAPALMMGGIGLRDQELHLSLL